MSEYDFQVMRKLIFLLFLTLSTSVVAAQQYELVLEGGRVIDPETGLVATRNVGIRDGKIARIESEALNGRHVVRAVGKSLWSLSTETPVHAAGP